MAWPRELYLSVLGCKAIVAPSQSQRSRAPASRCAESETTTASVTTEGDGDRDAGGAGSGGSGAIDPETATPGVSNPETVAAAGVSNNNPETAAAAGVSEGVGSGVAGNGDVGRKAGADEAATSTAEESGGKEGGEVEEAGEGEGGGGGGGDGAASSEGEGKGWADGAGDFDEEAEDGGVGCFVRIRNATTGRDLQVMGGGGRTALYFFRSKVGILGSGSLVSRSVRVVPDTFCFCFFLSSHSIPLLSVPPIISGVTCQAVLSPPRDGSCLVFTVYRSPWLQL